MSGKGGKTKNAGNKEGSIRPNFNLYWSEDDVAEYMTYLKKNYKKDTRLATYVGDHIFGKAVQPIGNDGDKPLLVKFDSSFKK